MSEREEIEAALRALEPIARNRGVENGWLWEVAPDAPYGFTPDTDPRVPLVHGGPDVVLQSAVLPMMTVLRSAIEWLDKGEAEWATAVWDRHPEMKTALSNLIRQELELARAIVAASPDITKGNDA